MIRRVLIVLAWVAFLTLFLLGAIDPIPYRQGAAAQQYPVTLKHDEKVPAVTAPLPASAGKPALIPGGVGAMSARIPGGKEDLPFVLEKQTVTVTITGSVARTDVEQVFRNPSPSIVEGTYRFSPPRGAAIFRYGMEIKGRLMEGLIVERKRGRGIMEDVIDRFYEKMRDPALVEWEGGSVFSSRIFPILPGEKKRIVVSYAHLLPLEDGRVRYVLPLAAPGASAPSIPSLDLRADIAGVPASSVTTPLYPATVEPGAGSAVVLFRAEDFSPQADFVIDIEATGGDGPGLVAASASKDPEAWTYFFMRWVAETLPDDGFTAGGKRDWIFLVDTSRSRGPAAMETQTSLVVSMLAALPDGDRARIMTYDMKPGFIRETWAAPSVPFNESVRSALDAVVPAGATNLKAALEAASGAVEAGNPTTIVLLGDGTATLGETRPGKIADLAAHLGVPLVAVAVGGGADEILLGELARRTGGLFFHVSTGENIPAAARDIVASTTSPILSGVKVGFEGAAQVEVFPEAFGNLAAGKTLDVLGRVKGKMPGAALVSGLVGGQPFEHRVSLSPAPGAPADSVIPVLWASKKIESLVMGEDEASIEETIRLSKRFSLPTRHTSFIVLESGAMAKEYKVGAAPPKAAAFFDDGPSPARSPKGPGKSWGHSHGVALHARSTGVPHIVVNACRIMGHISKETILKTVKQHRNEVRGCYEKELQSDPDLEGRVVLKFVITPTGYVAMTQVASSTLGNPEVETCIKDAALKWIFPAHESGGLSIVNYPFVFMNAEKLAAEEEDTWPVEEKEAAPAQEEDPLPNPAWSPGPDNPFLEGMLDVMDEGVPPDREPDDPDDEWIEPPRVVIKILPAYEPSPKASGPKALVSWLMKTGRYAEALERASSWAAADGAGSSTLKALAELLRLAGRPDEALRVASGILDVDSENVEILDDLARTFESRGEWGEAWPFRHTLSLLDPGPTAGAAAAVAAARAGFPDEAAKIARDVLDGLPPSSKKISPAKKALLARLSAGEHSMLVFDLPGDYTPSSSELTVELVHDAGAKIRLFVLSKEGFTMGGGGSSGKIMTGPKGGELFYMGRAREGAFRIQVACAGPPGSCDGAAGKVFIDALGTKKTVPFVMKDVWGTDLALVRIRPL
jgi:hypothetical protein